MAQKLLLIFVTLLFLAVGVFSFASYRENARHAEVPLNLRDMYDGAVNYAQRYLLRPVEERIRPGFPLSTPVTPDLSCCHEGKVVPCAPGGRGPTAYDPRQWKTTTFIELGFELLDPHRYRYSFEATDPADELHFTVNAWGEPACDGRLTRYYRKGTVQGTRIFGPLEIFVENK